MTEPVIELSEATPPFDTDRVAAHTLAFRLTRDVQAGISGAREQLARLAARVEASGWGEVTRACLFSDVVIAWIGQDDTISAALEALVERCERDGDSAMLATALALRSDQGFSGSSQPADMDREEDLARAMVLLERTGSGVLERISGHTACAIALGNRWLFELSDEQYSAALAIGESERPGTIDFILAPIMFNLAEEQVSWASLLLQLDDRDGVAKQWHEWKSAAAATALYEMPDAWKFELEALGVVLGAIAGEDTANEAHSLLDALDIDGEDRRRSSGILKLGVAVSDVFGGRPDRARTAREAVDALDPDVHPHLFDLALFLSATVESEEGRSAGLRYARRQLDQHWGKRLASLGAMRSRIDAERLSIERDLLTRHARLDDLTGIGNRRALDTFIGELQSREAASVAVALFDIDAFKSVNDQRGHLVGDAVLIRLARSLERGITSDDLAVRLGGDEFVVVMADVDGETAGNRAVAILDSLRKESFEEISPGLAIRASAGVAVGTASAIQRTRALADAALYRAKAAGGGRVERDTRRPTPAA